MLTLGNKIIAGSFKAGASWEVGDVGVSAFGIDEALNKRRYLNGQVISQAQFVEFTAMLKSRVSVYPNLETTEVNWQAEVTNSKLGQCGKFVIDDVAGTIRLPKVVNINGLQNLAVLGGIKAESLPNITGQYTSGSWITVDPKTGAFANITTRNNETGGSSGSDTNFKRAYIKFDASLSSSTYQDDAPVQQEAVQYPYFIQVATGVETSIDVSREIELNNPFSLLDYKYSEYELSNASWLLSNGQWNSGAVYQSVYDLLLQELNGTTTKAGVSVKLSTETYADTDFVLNTTDTTFRLPLKVALASGKAVVGNGMTLGLTNGTTNSGLTEYEFSGLDHLGANPLAYGEQVTTGSTIGSMVRGYTGITTDETKSGIETSANGLYLYFYVGEVVQDANLIAAAGVLTDMTNIKNGVGYSQLGTSFISEQAMPSGRYDDLTLGASGSEYVAPANGYVCLSKATTANNQVVAISVGKEGVTTISSSADVEYGCGNFLPNYNYLFNCVPVPKGRVYEIVYDAGGALQAFRFIYAEGEN